MKTQTPRTWQLPLIYWQRGPQVKTIGKEVWFLATGQSENSFRIFSGVWIEENGEFVNVGEIDEEL